MSREARRRSAGAWSRGRAASRLRRRSTGSPSSRPPASRPASCAARRWAAGASCPRACKITQSAAVLSALRRRPPGRRSRCCSTAPSRPRSPTLPFAADLEVVARSPALPAGVVAAVDRRLPAARWAKLGAALRELPADPAGAEALAGDPDVALRPARREGALRRAQGLRGGAAGDESPRPAPRRSRRRARPARPRCGSRRRSRGAPRDAGASADELLRSADAAWARRADPAQARAAQELYLEAASADEAPRRRAPRRDARGRRSGSSASATRRRGSALAVAGGPARAVVPAPGARATRRARTGSRSRSGSRRGSGPPRRRTRSARMVKLLREAIAADPRLDHAGPHRVLALVLLRAPGWPVGPGDPEGALGEARAAAALFPDAAGEPARARRGARQERPRRRGPRGLRAGRRARGAGRRRRRPGGRALARRGARGARPRRPTVTSPLLLALVLAGALGAAAPAAARAGADRPAPRGRGARAPDHGGWRHALGLGPHSTTFFSEEGSQYTFHSGSLGYLGVARRRAARSCTRSCSCRSRRARTGTSTPPATTTAGASGGDLLLGWQWRWSVPRGPRGGGGPGPARDLHLPARGSPGYRDFSALPLGLGRGGGPALGDRRAAASPGRSRSAPTRAPPSTSTIRCARTTWRTGSPFRAGMIVGLGARDEAAAGAAGPRGRCSRSRSAPAARTPRWRRSSTSPRASPGTPGSPPPGRTGPSSGSLLVGEPGDGRHRPRSRSRRMQMPISRGDRGDHAPGAGGRRSGPRARPRSQVEHAYTLPDESSRVDPEPPRRVARGRAAHVRLTVTRDAGRLIVAGTTGLAGTYVALGEALGRLGSATERDAACAFQIANLGIRSSEDPDHRLRRPRHDPVPAARRPTSARWRGACASR